MKKIAIIGTSSYIDRMKNHKAVLENEGAEVRLPALDSHPELNAYGVCEYNLKMIEWADEIHVFWDQRSLGTMFDFGIAFALRKPIRCIYIEPKTFAQVLKEYEGRI